MSGVAMHRSKLISALLTCSARSSAPTMSAPAFLASSAFGPFAKTASAGCARYRSEANHAAHHLVGVPRIDAEIDRKLDRFVELGRRTGFDELHRVFDGIAFFTGSSRSRPFPKRLDIFAMAYPLTLIPIERAEPSIRTHRHLHIVRVQVLHFRFGDRRAPGRGSPNRQYRVRAPSTPAVKLRRLLQEIGGGRRLHLEGKGLVRKYGDRHRNWHALFLLLRLRVERFAELHDVETALTERRSDRRRRIGRPAGTCSLM